MTGTENFERLGDRELLEAFKQGDAPGTAVMERVFMKTNLAAEVPDIASRQLHRKADGSPIVDEGGNPVSAGQYLDVARNHGAALPSILGFVATPEDDPNFPALRSTMRTVILGYLES